MKLPTPSPSSVLAVVVGAASGALAFFLLSPAPAIPSQAELDKLERVRTEIMKIREVE